MLPARLDASPPLSKCGQTTDFLPWAGSRKHRVFSPHLALVLDGLKEVFTEPFPYRHPSNHFPRGVFSGGYNRVFGYTAELA